MSLLQTALQFDTPHAPTVKRITEIVLPDSGGLQTQLILPIVAHLSHAQEDRWTTWIGPLWLSKNASSIYPINWSSLLQVLPKQGDLSLSVIERALLSGKSHTVIGYSNHPLDQEQIEKLELAAREGNCQGLIIRSR